MLKEKLKIRLIYVNMYIIYILYAHIFSEFCVFEATLYNLLKLPIHQNFEFIVRIDCRFVTSDKS
jgi:hypothetical protein